MIQVTRLDGTRYYINSDLIQTIEPTPDSVITLTTGVKIVVRESPEILLERIVEFRRRVLGMDKKSRKVERMKGSEEAQE